jgi:phosphopantetheine adenylyltransferase
MGKAHAIVDSKTEEEISTTVKEGTKRKQRIKVKQKSKQTPQRAPVVAINWLLKHLRELRDFRNELQWWWI